MSIASNGNLTAINDRLEETSLGSFKLANLCLS